MRVLAPDGEVLASNDREGEVNARDWHDHITVWTRIRTLDYARADRVRRGGLLSGLNLTSIRNNALLENS